MLMWERMQTDNPCNGKRMGVSGYLRQLGNYLNLKINLSG
jgi:hypothetical protein